MKCHQVFLWCECFSAIVTSSGTFLSFSSQALSSFIFPSLFTLISIGGISSLSNSRHSTLLWAVHFVITFPLISISLILLSFFISWLHFQLCWPIFSFDDPFSVKSHMGLSVGQGVITCLVSLRELNHVCSDQFSKD